MTRAAARPMEVELKYTLSRAAVGEAVIAADEIAGLVALGPVTTVRAEDRYIDTPDGALAAAGYAGRLRRTRTRTVITLKGLVRADDGGAAHRREELEGVADESLPPAAWPASAARDAILEIVGAGALQELVVLRQVRRKRLYGIDGAVVELSLDEVEVVTGGRVVDRFRELEAELIEGDEAVLLPLATLLELDPSMTPASRSKLERALEAVRRDSGTPPPEQPAPTATTTTTTTSEAETSAAPDEPVPAPPPRLTAGKTPGVLGDDDLAEAGRKVLRFHLARMVAREAGTRDGTANQELHGMRVATRRQRAAWRVFGDAFDQKRTARHQERLKEVARDLGAVRDLDVLIEAAETYQLGVPVAQQPGLDPLLSAWRARREEARVVLLRELDSKRYARWVEDYITFVQAEGMGARRFGPVDPHHVRDTMPSRIWAAYEGVRAYEPVMHWADVTTLHDLRIAAKWLRYTIEFVREALGADAGPVIERVVALQDHLGFLHDADVAAGLARAFLVEQGGRLSPDEDAAIGRYLVDRERELARLRRTIGPVWQGLSDLAFRRALGRLVAGL